MIYTAAYRPRDRAEDRAVERRIAARLLQDGLAREYGLPDTSPRLCANAYGKPALADRPDIYFNISHCTGMVACALSPVPIGIDVERIRAYDERVARRVLTAAEQQYGGELARRGVYTADEVFFRLWTLKESYGKAVGTGLAASMHDIVFDCLEDGEIRSNQPLWQFTQHKFEKNFILAVCRAYNG